MVYLKLLLAFLLLLPTQTAWGEEAPPSLFPIDVLIDVGHGGVDGGTVEGGIFEKDINLEIGTKLYKYLGDRGYSVVINRDGDYALSGDNHWMKSPSRHRKDLAQRTELVNIIEPKVMVSLHVNWSSSSTRRGPVVLYQKSYLSRNLALLIQNALNDEVEIFTPSVPGAPYFVLNNTNVPAVIVEMGFISNAKDRKMLMNERSQRRIARAIAEGIERYFILFH